MGFLEQKLKQYGYDVDVRTGEIRPMKKSKVKKWEQSYGVGIAYFGVLTLHQIEFYNHEDDAMGGYSFAQNAKFRGVMQKVIEGIPVDVVGYISAQIQNIKIADEYDIMLGEYENGDREVPREMAEEIADASNYRATKATYTYSLWYNDPSNTEYGRAYNIYDSDEDGDSRSAKYSSIEDCIRAMEQESEKAYGKVMEYVNGEMAKSCNDKAKKSEVKKDDDSRAYEEATSLYAYMNTVQDAIAQLDLYVRRLHNRIVDGEPTAQASSDVIDWVDTSISALEGIKLKAQIMSKSKKSSVKKAPMGLDEYGNSVWIDEKDVFSGAPESFQINLAGKSMTCKHDDNNPGFEGNFANSRMWVAEGGNFFAVLEVAPDGEFVGNFGQYQDDGGIKGRMDFEGRSNDVNSIIQNFQRFCDNVGSNPNSWESF